MTTDPFAPGTHVTVEKSAYSPRAELRIYTIGHNGAYATRPEITMVPIAEGDSLPHAGTLGPDQCQELMDSLWMIGVRPTAGSGSAGSLKATEKHLEDMRKIAFGMLKDQVGP